MKEGGRKLPLPVLPKLQSVLGSKTEGDKIIKDVAQPEEEKDVVTKEYADATYTAI